MISRKFRNWLGTALLILLTIGMCAQSRPQVVYEETFDKGIGRWEPFLGYWRLNDKQWHWSLDGGKDGGCLMHEAGMGVKDPGRGAHDAMIIYRSRAVWQDYTFETDARASAGHFGVWFRARMHPSGEKDGRWVAGYTFSLDPRHKKAILWKTRRDGFDKDGKWQAHHFSNPVEVKSAQIPEFPPDTWVHIKIIVQGSQIQCFVDDERVINAEDSTFSYGSIGFIAYKAPDARFDNVRVVALPPTHDSPGGKPD